MNTLDVLRELVAVEDLKRSLAQANHHAARFPTDENYTVIGQLSTEIATRRKAAWAAARGIVSGAAGETRSGSTPQGQEPGPGGSRPEKGEEGERQPATPEAPAESICEECGRHMSFSDGIAPTRFCIVCAQAIAERSTPSPQAPQAGELAERRAIMSRCYEEFCGRDFMHLPLDEAIRAASAAKDPQAQAAAEEAVWALRHGPAPLQVMADEAQELGLGYEPFLCIRLACGADCSGCNCAISPQQQRDYAIRYAFLREQPLDAVRQGGIFAGKTPDNLVMNGADLDAAIDAATTQGAKK